MVEEPEDPYTSKTDVICTGCGLLWHEEQVQVISRLIQPDPVTGVVAFGLCAGCLGEREMEPRCPTCHRPFWPSA